MKTLLDNGGLCLIYRKVSHLQIEQDSSDSHGLTDLQAVGEEGEAWGALVIGWQNLNVNCGDGAPEGRVKLRFLTA